MSSFSVEEESGVVMRDGEAVLALEKKPFKNRCVIAKRAFKREELILTVGDND